MNKSLAPVDVCGCGDVGYLAKRTLPVDLAHGVGSIRNVPVYTCRLSSCNQYTIPEAVSRRIDTLAEQMEALNILETEFMWETDTGKGESQVNDQDRLSLVLSFTLQFANRTYEDARVVLVVPGQVVFFQSTVESGEYYLLQHNPEVDAKEIYFTFSKFYYDEPDFNYERFNQWSENGHIKELAILGLDEVEEILCDEFGEII